MKNGEARFREVVLEEGRRRLGGAGGNNIPDHTWSMWSVEAVHMSHNVYNFSSLYSGNIFNSFLQEIILGMKPWFHKISFFSHVLDGVKLLLTVILLIF